MKVRFNTNYGKLRNGIRDTKMWRVLIDDKQYFVENVKIMQNSFTTKDIVIGDDGNDVEKYHLTINTTEHLITGNYAVIGTSKGSIKFDAVTINEDDNSHRQEYKINWATEDNKWRILTPEKEILVDDIEINTVCYTTDMYVGILAKEIKIENNKAIIL